MCLLNSLFSLFMTKKKKIFSDDQLSHLFSGTLSSPCNNLPTNLHSFLTLDAFKLSMKICVELSLCFAFFSRMSRNDKSYVCICRWRLHLRHLFYRDINSLKDFVWYPKKFPFVFEDVLVGKIIVDKNPNSFFWTWNIS